MIIKTAVHKFTPFVAIFKRPFIASSLAAELYVDKGNGVKRDYVSSLIWPFNNNAIILSFR